MCRAVWFLRVVFYPFQANENPEVGGFEDGVVQNEHYPL